MRESVNQMMARTQQVIPLSPANKVKQVTKNENGDLSVELHGGEKFTIDKDDPQIQAFVVWTVLANA